MVVFLFFQKMLVGDKHLSEKEETQSVVFSSFSVELFEIERWVC